MDTRDLLPADDGEDAMPLWRRIEMAIRRDILDGVYPPGSQLPPDRQIAARHGTSRVTARRALAMLEQNGFLRIEHGNGTFVAEDALIRYRMSGDRIRFGKDWIAADGTRLHRRILSRREIPADARLADHLGLAIGAPVLALQIVAFAGERPLSVGIRHCDALRFRGLAEAFERLQSMTAAQAEFGVEDYRRASTDVTARLPTPEEARILAQSRVHPVLAYAATDVETASGRIVSYHVGCFAADRVVITIGETGP